MEQAKIDRINALAKKAKSPEGLTPEETAERDRLRQEYIAAYRASLVSQLENTYIVEPDGTKHKLGKKPLKKAAPPLGGAAFPVHRRSKNTYHNPRAQGELHQQQGGQAVPEIPVAGLVPKGPHAQEGPRRAAQQGYAEEGPLGHPPAVVPGLPLVHTHEDKVQEAGAQHPEQKILHAGSPRAATKPPRRLVVSYQSLRSMRSALPLSRMTAVVSSRAVMVTQCQ